VSHSFYIKCLMCPLCSWTTHPRLQRHCPMAWLTKRCSSLPTQRRSPASAGWLSWIGNSDKPSVEVHPKQYNWPNLSSGCLGATCQARSALISGVAGLRAWSDISQGSVTTHLKCGGNDSFITNCLLILTVKEFWKSVNIWRNYKVYKKWCHFLAHPVCV